MHYNISQQLHNTHVFPLTIQTEHKVIILILTSLQSSVKKKLQQPLIFNDSHWFEKKYEICQIKRMEDENSSLDKKCNFISFRRRETGNPIIV